ncbi:phosphotransferase [Nocardia sp. NPDC048505]|uniref:phosphotransferase family protein n=1 Tax=Nocardia sp. NPDC048505 TaxID=3155756 RepID=UPI0033D20F74
MPLELDIFAALELSCREAGAAGQPEILADRSDAAVVRVGGFVAKAHPRDTDEAALRARLQLACHPWLRDILAEPHTGQIVLHRANRLITVWPFGETVDPDDPDGAPWEAAATLLAQLHGLPLTSHSNQAARPANSSRTANRRRTVPGSITHPQPGSDRARTTARTHEPGTTGTSGASTMKHAADSGATRPGADPPQLITRTDTAGAETDAIDAGAERKPFDAHAASVPVAALPAAGGPARVRRAMRRLARATELEGAAAEAIDTPAAAVVRRAFAGLPASVTEGTFETVRKPAAEVRHPRPNHLVHGDFHLGQLVRLPTAHENPWRLVDLDDLGYGDPAWDLARPAAFYLAGVLDPSAWERFLNAYRHAGGPAVPEHGDPWAALEIPARAVVIQAAALAVAAAALAGRALDDIDRALVDTCHRIAGIS